MKKLSILSIYFSLLSCFITNAQKVRLGVSADTRNGELRTTDQLNGKKYYAGYPITLKKGMGAVFFMESSVFTPYILLFSAGNGKYFGKPFLEKEKEIQRTKVSFVAPVDTAFYVILTSANDNETGAFKYGFYLLDSAQMNFQDNYTACDKLTFLLNHWELHWELMPGEFKTYIDDEDPRLNSNYLSVWNTFTASGKANITDHYNEVIYSEKEGFVEDAALNALIKDAVNAPEPGKPTGKSVYNKICSDIKACLDMKAWTVETEQTETKTLLGTIKSDITHFISAGSKKNEKQGSFKVLFTTGGTVNPTEVKLVFN